MSMTIDYTTTYTFLDIINIVTGNDILEYAMLYDYKLLSNLVRINSKFHEQFQPYLLSMEDRLCTVLNKMTTR